jgi:bifunctional enzyme CysN/CysC
VDERGAPAAGPVLSHARRNEDAARPGDHAQSQDRRNTLEQRPGRTLGLNEIGFCNLSTASPVAFDAYASNRRTGAFILIDRFTNTTARAGMIAFGLRRATNIHRQSHLIDKAARAALNHQMPCVLWFTGLSGSGKSTIANLVEKALHERGTP